MFWFSGKNDWKQKKYKKRIAAAMFSIKGAENLIDHNKSLPKNRFDKKMLMVTLLEKLKPVVLVKLEYSDMIWSEMISVLWYDLKRHMILSWILLRPQIISIQDGTKTEIACFEKYLKRFQTAI